MKTITVLVVALLTATPAFAQSRLYTNADLTTKPVTWSRTVTPEELRGLKAREFHLPPPAPRDDGPTVIIATHTPLFAPFEPTRPLSEPWSMTTYLGPSWAGGCCPSPYVSLPPSAWPDPRPGIHLRYP